MHLHMLVNIWYCTVVLHVVASALVKVEIDGKSGIELNKALKCSWRIVPIAFDWCVLCVWLVFIRSSLSLSTCILHLLRIPGGYSCCCAYSAVHILHITQLSD